MMRVEDNYDWRNPNAGLIFQARLKRLRWLRSGTPEARASRVAALKVYYRDHPADFINDWAVTVDPRNMERGLPVLVPFLLFPKQRELIDAMLRNWRASKGMAMPKSRDVGASCSFIGVMPARRHFWFGYWPAQAAATGSSL